MGYTPHKEKKIEDEIKQFIKEHGGLCYKIHGAERIVLKHELSLDFVGTV